MTRRPYGSPTGSVWPRAGGGWNWAVTENGDPHRPFSLKNGEVCVTRGEVMEDAAEGWRRTPRAASREAGRALKRIRKMQDHLSQPTRRVPG